MSASKDYRRAVEEGARHHANSKTYSGSFLRPHKPYLSALIADLGVASAIDYGCGKGRQYEWVDPADGKTLEQIWGFDVFKYDPCYEPFSAEPQGPADLVICTHTLSLIPEADLQWVVERLFSLATKAVFIAEKIGGRKKSEVADPHNRAIAWPVARWLEFIAPIADARPDIHAVFSSREKINGASIMTRHVRKGEQWQS